MNLFNEYLPNTLEHQGLAITYYDSGEPAVKNNRLPLVLIHGTAGSTNTHFGYLFPLLATRCRVISVDWQDITEDELELDDLIQQIRAVIQAVLGNQKYSLLGYSLGAVVAAKFAVEAKAQVKNLILLAGWQKTDVQQSLRNHIWKTLRQENSAALKAFMGFCAFSNNLIQMASLDKHLSDFGNIPVTTFVDKQMALNTRIDISDSVTQIQAKTLVIGCSYDQMVPVHHSKQLFGTIANACYAEVPSGHGVVFERPAEVFKYLDHFTAAPDTFVAGSIIHPKQA
ncbi:alpha/beta fold hydrolase [Acinetobacter chengduensis]|uniref:Alpha/beta hydrolase n=1 Tax=Acinetobacter chengduensis TaxID=2420890 RepID=A0ABX9TVT7_9GAMM|nr:alpha/beta hydrolase [Acinetobacter chengduensis]RLL21815.1 alpha/beta hydrolase [Acinetobacter chengduensis]